jgi:tetratricopeptide (TPR) repeat protein
VRRLPTLLAALCVGVPLWAAAQQDAGVRQQADRAYREGRYQAAYDGYQQELRTGGPAGELLYNLGNAAWRLNQPGRAILYYERARLLLPRDADLAYNLNHVRGQLRDLTPEATDFSDMAFSWLGSLTLAEVFWFFAAANLLFWSHLALRLVTRAEWTYSLLFLLLALWLLAGACFGIKWRQVSGDDRAVILQPEVGVLAGPDARDTVLFKLHEGTVVRRVRSEDAWSLIRLPDGKRGWLRSDAVAAIAP